MWAAALGLAACMLAAPLRAEPAVTILPLPFAVTQMRPPESEVATALATSPLLRGAGPVPAAGLVAAWGEAGAAALAPIEGAVRVRALDPEGVRDIAQVETPRDAPAGSRRAVLGPLTAHLVQPGVLGAGAVVLRERKPVARSAEPKPVPVETATVPAGADAAFADRALHLLLLAGRPVLAVARATPGDGATLALIGRDADGGAWRILAQTPSPGAAHPRLALAAAADFEGTGRSQLATLRDDGRLELWAEEGGRLTSRAQATGYAAPDPAVPDAAAVLETEGGPVLAVPSADGTALVFVAFKGGLRERGRVALPAPARLGVAVLGRGRDAHVLVGLADGRIAAVRPGPLAP